MKKLLLLLPFLLAWCSDYDEATRLQIQELEKQATIAKVACDNLQTVNNKIKSLKGYLWSESASMPPQEWISNDSKPQVEDICTPVYTACYDNWTVNIEWETDCRENYKEVKDCDWLFWNVVWCYEKTDWTLCLLNNDTDKLNELFKF